MCCSYPACLAISDKGDEMVQVGDTTTHGKILSESVKWDNHEQIVSLYDDSDREVFTVILWDKPNNFSISEDIYATDEEAVQAYVGLAFGM